MMRFNNVVSNEHMLDDTHKWKKREERASWVRWYLSLACRR